MALKTLQIGLAVDQPNASRAFLKYGKDSDFLRFTSSLLYFIMIAGK